MAPRRRTRQAKVVTAWRGFAVTAYTYDLAEALAVAWQRVLELPTHHHKTAVTPPLYIRYLRFRATEDYELPLIVFDIAFHVGEALDAVASKAMAQTPAPAARAPATAPGSAGRARGGGRPQRSAVVPSGLSKGRGAAGGGGGGGRLAAPGN